MCGDPACGSCFPSGQARVKCTSCTWKGKRYECGTDEQSDRIIDICPECEGDAEEQE